MGSALLVRGLPTLASNLFLLAAIHGRKSAIFFCHVDPLVLVRPVEQDCATAVPRRARARMGGKSADSRLTVELLGKLSGSVRDAVGAHTV
jgi:hypothetical protein